MAIFKKNGAKEEGMDNIFWTTMSDLMLGLCIVFMTLFILAMTGFTQENLRQQKQQIEIAKQLAEKLRAEKIHAEVDNLSGSVKISDVELFEVKSCVFLCHVQCLFYSPSSSGDADLVIALFAEAEHLVLVVVDG